jgi:hypothetical protein
MLFSFHERKIFIRNQWNIHIHIYIRFHQCCDQRVSSMCMCAKYIMVTFNVCVRLGSILTSAYAFRNMRFFSSKSETSVFSIKKPTKLECVCTYIYWVNQGNCAISIWCVYWMTRCLCGWIFLQHYVITFCETIIKCAHVWLTVASEFDFTSTFLVWHWIRCTLLLDLWRIDL